MKGYSEAIKQLLPKIRARRAEIEDARRIPSDLATALQQTGVFTLGVPKAIGGAEAPPADIMRAIETVAAADGSTGWCTMIAISGNLSAGFMQEPGAKEVFVDPAAPSAVIVAPIGKATRHDGGLRITGHWPFGSGIDNCEWVTVGAIIHENDAPVMTPHGPALVHAFMRVAEGTIHDTWYVSGLSGTGSSDFSCTDVFVPEQRIFNIFDPSDHRSEPLYQMPPTAGFVPLLASVSLGIARAALDELTELAATKVPTLSQVVLADKPFAQIELARAEVAHGAARSFLYDSVEDVWQTVLAGREATMRQVAICRAAAVHAVETSADVARRMNVLAGGSAILLTNSLQRHARDAEAILHHFTQSPHTWEDAGRVLLGRDPTVPVF